MSTDEEKRPRNETTFYDMSMLFQDVPKESLLVLPKGEKTREVSLNKLSEEHRKLFTDVSDVAE